MIRLLWSAMIFVDFEIDTYVSCHVFQTVVEPSEHFRELLAPHKVSCSRRIQSPRDWLQIIVVFQVVIEPVSQPSDPFLFVQ